MSDDGFPYDRTPPFGPTREALGATLTRVRKQKPRDYTDAEIDAMDPEEYQEKFPHALEAPLEPGKVIRFHDTIVMPISDALRECLKDPDFLRRLDGAILHSRQFYTYRFSDDYFEDNDWDAYLAESMIQLIGGKDIWAKMKAFDHEREVQKLERELQEKKRKL